MEGIIHGLSNEDYHHGEGYKDYLSSSQLKDFLISPKYAKYKAEHPEEFEISDDALEFGSMYHAYMESFVRHGDDRDFQERYHVFVAPVNEKTGKPYGRDTNKYQVSLEAVKQEHPDWEFVSQERKDRIVKMADELLTNCGSTSSLVKTVVKRGEAEVSHFVEYKGCKFKFRPDVETNAKIIDWKTTSLESLHPRAISKAIVKFGYGISAAFYQFFEHEQSGVWKDFYWVFQQKDPPYDAVMVSAELWAFSYNKEDDIVSLGPCAVLFNTLLEQYIECKKTGDFPGAEIFIEPGYRGHRIMTPEASPSVGDLLFYNNQ